MFRSQLIKWCHTSTAPLACSTEAGADPVCVLAAQVQGGGLRDSFLVDGVAFKKTFSYAGFEMQPRSFTDPPILLLNIELELKAEKENAEVRRLPPCDGRHIIMCGTTHGVRRKYTG